MSDGDAKRVAAIRAGGTPSVEDVQFLLRLIDCQSALVTVAEAWLAAEDASANARYAAALKMSEYRRDMAKAKAATTTAK